MTRPMALALVLLVAQGAIARAGDLSAEDAAALAGVLERSGLFDPKGARRVRTTVLVRTGEYSNEGSTPAEGWARPGEGRPTWLLRDDLAWAPVAPGAAVEPADFVATLRARVADEDVVFDPFRSAGALGWAAWAHRLGQDDLAAATLARVRKVGPTHTGYGDGSPGALTDWVRHDVARGDFRAAARQLMVHEDAEALGFARALGRSPDLLDAFGNGTELLRDLERRATERPVELPADLDARPVPERVALLVRALDGVDVRQRDQPGTGGVGLDRRVRDLVRLGDAAVQPLLDCFARDERLTRAVTFADPETLHILTVREVALSTLREILPMDEVVNPIVAYGMPLDQLAEQIRTYWTANQGTPAAERARRRLIAPDADIDARHAATWQLEACDPAQVLALTGPSAAEAVLAAYDQAHGDEGVYLVALRMFGDARIAPALRERFAAAETPRRVALALVLEALGDHAALDGLARMLAADGARFAPPALDEDDLLGLVAALSAADRPAADAALVALADPKHPLYGTLLARCVGGYGVSSDNPWTQHPYCLRVLRAALRSEVASGIDYRRDANGWIARIVGGQGTSSPALPWVDLSRCGDQVRARWCDEAAFALGLHDLALPRFHPLLADRAARLEAVRAASANVELARRPTSIERAILGVGGAVFIPDLTPLDHAATVADVASGRAVFHLEGSRRADVKLPAWTELSRPDGSTVRGLVVQAEVGADGAQVLGVISLDGAGPVPATAAKGPWPLPTAAAQAAAVATFVDAVLTDDARTLASFYRPEVEADWITDEARRMWADARGRRADLTRRVEAALRPLPGGGWRFPDPW